MPEPRFAVLRQRLLEGGIAPRRARRVLQELRAHFADLQAEQERAGLQGSTAAQAAFQQLGTQETLARQILERPELRSWSRRWPWAVYALAPLLLFPAAFTLLLALVIGLIRALQGLRQVSPAQLVGVFHAFGFFGLYILPALLAATMALLACRRRVSPGWSLLSIAVLALWGAATNFHVTAHVVGAGVGLSTNPDKLARLLLYRWLPTAAAAAAVYALALLVRRAGQRRRQAAGGIEDAEDGIGGADGDPAIPE